MQPIHGQISFATCSYVCARKSALLCIDFINKDVDCLDLLLSTSLSAALEYLILFSGQVGNKICFQLYVT